MLTNSQILRTLETGDYRRLVERLMSNGRCLSRTARLALTDPLVAESAALGLALQRLCELTYWPHPDGLSIAHRLMRLQQRDGLFARPADERSQHLRVAATAVALRSLITWARQSGPVAATAADQTDRLVMIRGCIDRAWLALARHWRKCGAATVGEDDDLPSGVSWAVVLWQLGDCDDALLRLPIAQIRKSLESASADVLADDVSRLALTLAA